MGKLTTRQARKEFRDTFGRDAYDVVSRIEKGHDTDTIVDRTGLTVGTVAAYRANHTRGVYSDFVPGCKFQELNGTCFMLGQVPKGNKR